MAFQNNYFDLEMLSKSSNKFINMVCLMPWNCYLLILQFIQVLKMLNICCNFVLYVQWRAVQFMFDIGWHWTDKVYSFFQTLLLLQCYRVANIHLSLLHVYAQTLRVKICQWPWNTSKATKSPMYIVNIVFEYVNDCVIFSVTKHEYISYWSSFQVYKVANIV